MLPAAVEAAVDVLSVWMTVGYAVEGAESRVIAGEALVEPRGATTSESAVGTAALGGAHKRSALRSAGTRSAPRAASTIESWINKVNKERYQATAVCGNTHTRMQR